MKYILAAILTLLCASTVWGNNKEFGLGQPTDVSQLPPGKLKLDIESLTIKARENVMKRLQEVSIPENDMVNLHVSPDGELVYVDPAPEDRNDTLEQLGSLPVVDHEITFTLHSKPNAETKIYLDFDGEDLSEGRYWNYIHGNNYQPVYIAQPYDILDNGPEFSQRELEYIYAIWQRVSEDYAPFNVDVTTERPESLLGNGHVLITKSRYINQYGEEKCMYACSAGGVAWLNKWGQPFYQPALVYYNNLRTVSYTAECSSHENGHSLGLTHDGTSSTGYYRGHGDGLIDWAPIMGNSYYNNVSTWSIGEYPDANNTQDDIAMIAAKVGYEVDDYPDTMGEAIVMPDHGFIHSETDVDWFFFDVSEDGWLELDVSPSWYNLDFTLHLDDRRGSNLDVEVALVDPEGNVTLFDNPEDTQSQIRQSVDVGRYHIQVTGADSINYTKYNSMGEYVITGEVLPGNQQPTAVTHKVCPQNSYAADGITVYAFRKTTDVRMSGENSSDKDGSIASYEWRGSSGSVVSTDAILELSLRKGHYEYTLVVTDDEGMESIGSTQILDVIRSPYKGKQNKYVKVAQRYCQ